ncbi:hypothetical protein N9Z94_01680 [Akkermansiaceae bacterium]|nr:hypothetical protein [Akkermansiaceae bacterium]
MNLDQILLFRIAGLMCLGLIVANFIGAKRLGYAASLVQAEMIVRQIFYVHCGYIVMIITGLAILCLGWPELLLADGMGRVVSGFFGIFWGTRVVLQLTYYDKKLRAKERGWDLFFLGVFLALAIIFILGAL